MHGARLSPSDWHERGRRVFREEVEDDPDAEAGFLDDQCMRGARDDRQLGIRDAAVRCKRWPIEIVDSCVHRDVHNYPRSSPTRSFGPITARRSMVGESNSIKSTSRVARRRAPSTAGSSARRRRVGGRLPSSHLARRGEARARARADPRRPGYLVRRQRRHLPDRPRLRATGEAGQWLGRHQRRAPAIPCGCDMNASVIAEAVSWVIRPRAVRHGHGRGRRGG